MGKRYGDEDQGYDQNVTLNYIFRVKKSRRSDIERGTIRYGPSCDHLV